MPEPFRLYLDQMFKLDVAQALREGGHDVIRASEIGQDRADNQEILQKAIAENRMDKDRIEMNHLFSPFSEILLNQRGHLCRFAFCRDGSCCPG